MGSISIDGVPYAYDDTGEGVPIVFGHGLLADRRLFDEQIAALRDRFRCIAIDWPGHGDSGFDPAGWTLEDLATGAGKLIDALELERPVLVGLSQGGMIFMRLAASDPARFGGLALVDTSAAAEPPEMRESYEAMTTIMRDGTDSERANLVPFILQTLYATEWLDAHPAHASAESDYILALDRMGLALAGTAVFTRGDFTSRLGALARLPVEIIVGDQDAATPPDLSEQMLEHIPGATLTVIAGAGHHTPTENPAAVTAALERLLARLA